MTGPTRAGDGPAGSVPEHRLQVAHVLLGLLEQGAQGFGHVGQFERVGLGEALAVALELVGLEAQVGLEGRAAVGGRSTGGTVTMGSPPRNDTCSASIWAWESSWPTWTLSSSSTLRYSAPVMVAMWLVYCTIDWYSVPRSSLRSSTNFSTLTSAVCAMRCQYPVAGRSTQMRGDERGTRRRCTISSASFRRHSGVVQDTRAEFRTRPARPPRAGRDWRRHAVRRPGRCSGGPAARTRRRR